VERTDEQGIGALGPRALLLRGALVLVLVAAVVVTVELLVPGAGRRLQSADAAWLAVAVALEAIALVSYVAFFHAVFGRSPHRVRLRRSAEIALGELAGFALVPTGAGGPAVRLWALRGGGMPWRTIGVRSVVFGVILNIPYVGAALLFGLGVALGVLPGSAPTLVALAPLGLVVGSILLIVLIAATAQSRWMQGPARWKRNMRAVLAIVPAGVAELPWFARRPGRVAGAFGWWAFDCAVLWAAFQACGGSPAVGVIVLAYMLGQLGNVLPLPGGIGGVEPLMLGIFVASGVDTALAAAAIVCYRAIALGLQSISGVVSVASLVPAVRRERRESVGRLSRRTTPPTPPVPPQAVPSSPSAGAGA
jgi:putative heme transporter